MTNVKTSAAARIDAGGVAFSMLGWPDSFSVDHLFGICC
jgi:hypothetical protein